VSFWSLGTLLRRRSPILSDIRTWLHSHARFAKPLDLHRGHTDKALALILFRPTISPKSSSQAFKRPNRAWAAGGNAAHGVEPARRLRYFYVSAGGAAPHVTGRLKRQAALVHFQIQRYQICRRSMSSFRSLAELGRNQPQVRLAPKVDQYPTSPDFSASQPAIRSPRRRAAPGTERP
jgi:hypothetical protein